MTGTVSVHDPAGPLDERLDASSKHLNLEGCPIALLVEPVELETIDAQGLGESRGHRCLPAARPTLHDYSRQPTSGRPTFRHRSGLQITAH